MTSEDTGFEPRYDTAAAAADYIAWLRAGNQRQPPAALDCRHAIRSLPCRRRLPIVCGKDPTPLDPRTDCDRVPRHR
ncbi:hypothetical protein Acsp02_92670 [Actinoplanes sp. NBRC 103695]|nr:hypothetical protein Acsp02_92670 [Actinoplanes sp. NBRC 103695]